MGVSPLPSPAVTFFFCPSFQRENLTVCSSVSGGQSLPTPL
ncbi:hypothetical protein Nmel_012709 [Mimus melanotis]